VGCIGRRDYTHTMEINENERRLLAIACNGMLNFQACSKVYRNAEYGRNIIKRLVLMGYLEQDILNFGYFRITPIGLEVLLES